MIISSRVNLVGKVKNVNLEKRDVTISCLDQDVVVHFWTTLADQRGAWKSGDEWRNYILEGVYVAIHGYLGNNGRVVVAPGSAYVVGEPQLINNVDAICELAEDNKLLTQTPLGKLVVVEVENPERLTSFNVGDKLALLGIKLPESVNINYVERIQGDYVM